MATHAVEIDGFVPGSSVKVVEGGPGVHSCIGSAIAHGKDPLFGDLLSQHHVLFDVSRDCPDYGCCSSRVVAVDDFVCDQDAQGVWVGCHAVDGGEAVLQQLLVIRFEWCRPVDTNLWSGQALRSQTPGHQLLHRQNRGSFLGLAYNQHVDASLLEQFHRCIMAFRGINLVFLRSVAFCLCQEMRQCLQTQPTLTNEEGIQPQLLEGFQVSPQVLNSIISEHVSSRAPGSAVVLVHNPLHQELWPTGEVNRLIS